MGFDRDGVDAVFLGEREGGLDGRGVGAHQHERHVGLQVRAKLALALHEARDLCEHLVERDGARRTLR
jgi:hypothetical protein